MARQDRVSTRTPTRQRPPANPAATSRTSSCGEMNTPIKGRVHSRTRGLQGNGASRRTSQARRASERWTSHSGTCHSLARDSSRPAPAPVPRRAVDRLFPRRAARDRPRIDERRPQPARALTVHEGGGSPTDPRRPPRLPHRYRGPLSRAKPARLGPGHRVRGVRPDRELESLVAGVGTEGG